MEGHYCQTGVDVNQPDNSTNKGVGAPCPLGNYCPTGSDAPIPCDNGTYADETGLAACKVCPAGKWIISMSLGENYKRKFSWIVNLNNQ